MPPFLFYIEQVKRSYAYKYINNNYYIRHRFIIGYLSIFVRTNGYKPEFRGHKQNGNKICIEQKSHINKRKTYYNLIQRFNKQI